MVSLLTLIDLARFLTAIATCGRALRETAHANVLSSARCVSFACVLRTDNKASGCLPAKVHLSQWLSKIIVMTVTEV